MTAVDFCRDFARTQTVTELDLHIDSVTATGGTATVTFVAAGRDQGKVELRKAGGAWRVRAVKGRDYQPRI